MRDAPRASDAVEHARALGAEYTRQQIAFIDVELTTALTFLARAATVRQAGALDRVAAIAPICAAHKRGSGRSGRRHHAGRNRERISHGDLRKR